MDNTVGSLTQFQKSVIKGTILGDGYLRRLEGRSDAFLEINHSYKQKSYVDWKYQKLKNICLSPPKKRSSNNGRTAYRFFTKQHPYLTEMFYLFYNEKGKIIPSNIDIDKVTLAVWFMDDGSKCRDSDFYLNSQQFDKDSQEILIKKLKEHNLMSSLNKDKDYYRIRFRLESVKRLKELIAEYFIDDMRYKIN